MKKLSAGTVVFTRINGVVKYLLLKHVKSGTHWGFPKGAMEKGETEIQTAKRELKEETGITDFNFVPDFQLRDSYSFEHEGIAYDKIVIYFLVESKGDIAELSREHSDYVWGNYHESLKKIDKEAVRQILSRAKARIEELDRGLGGKIDH